MYPENFALSQGPAMATPNMLGLDPTHRQKLLEISRRLGLDLRNMQGATANRYDTVGIADLATPQTLEFFTDNNKARQFNNNQNPLKAGETIIVSHIGLEALVLTGTDLTINTTRITDNWPLGQRGGAFALSLIPFTSGILKFMSANGEVIRQFGLTELNPWNNKVNHSIALSNLADTGETLQMVGQNFLELPANPLLLPNNNFSVTLEVGPLNGIPSNSAIKITVGRFGSLYNANQPV